MCTPKVKKKTMELNTSCRAMNNSVSGDHQVSPSSRRFTGSQTPRGSILLGGSNRRAGRAARRAFQVLDSNNRYVTPLTLHHAELEVMQPKPDSLFLDGLSSSSGSEASKSTSSFSSVVSSRQPSSLSMSKESEDSISSPREVPWKKDKVIQHVTEEMLDDTVEIFLTETDTFTLLDIPSIIVSEDDADAGAIQERNIQYAELCKNRLGNDKYVARSSQTLYGENPKSIQTDKITMVDEGTVATGWDIYDSFCEQTPKGRNADCPGSSVNTSKGQQKRGEKNSSSGPGSTISSLSGMDMYGNSSNTEPDPKLIMLSKSFQRSLLVMERTIVRNMFQPKLAAYRHLPILEDPYSAMQPQTGKQDEEDEETSSSPSLERLWAFSCELTRGHTVTSMAWNKENTDILAVGYSDGHPGNQKPGLICSWTIKNVMWPEYVIHCHSSVTSLDFSANNPTQLAVGMYDGTVAIYNVPTQTCIADSSDCFNKHLQPVWQVTWSQQEVKLSGDCRAEVLISVLAEGRVTKWVLGNSGLTSLDLMMLKRSKEKTKLKGDKKKADCFLSELTPGYCVDFHPTDFSTYLACTGDGLIHKCSIYETKHFLDTYKNHICSVNHVEWSPFSSDVFLSCSSDWTIQLWKQYQLKPVFSFTSTLEAVRAVRWSPNWPTIFAAIKEHQVEIWDLNSMNMQPIIAHHTAPDVKMTSLLFARGTDCVLVGDTDGQVTVYKLCNLSAREGKEAELEVNLDLKVACGTVSL